MPDFEFFIDEFVQVFDGWSLSIEQKAKEFSQNRNEFLKQSNDTIKELNEKEKQIKEKVEKITFEQQKENQEINKLSESLSSLQIVENELPEQLEISQNQHKSLYKKYELILNELENEKKILTQKLKTIDNAISIYNNRLGLSFTTIPNHIKCTFTQIDPKSVDREFSFLLTLTDKNEYSISECSPSVPKEKIEMIITEVNRTNELCKVMKQMRILFKESI